MTFEWLFVICFTLYAAAWDPSELEKPLYASPELIIVQIDPPLYFLGPPPNVMRWKEQKPSPVVVGSLLVLSCLTGIVFLIRWGQWIGELQ